MTDGEHGTGCQLKPGNHWRDCVCAEIHPDDCPCVPCEGLEHGAETCAECRKLNDERVIARSKLPRTP